MRTDNMDTITADTMPPRFARKAADVAFAERLSEIRAKYGSLTAYLHRAPSRTRGASSKRKPRFTQIVRTAFIPKN